MKIILGFLFMLVAYSSTANVPIATINSIESFKLKNPGVKVIEMDVYEHHVDASRSYSLGGRQTGKKVFITIA